ncbi:hypothetical protein ARMGADRAFT_446423 [Armillaria gallica]|uniref:Uncharacterized protein n=1 Tax=Armillaria gallica TaxID=47427 RepID=A0A2H3CXU5_ARMGA|nr:hypothetical protein ARMGADRAFT_446423 [Armillaria gallica]
MKARRKEQGRTFGRRVSGNGSSSGASKVLTSGRCTSPTSVTYHHPSPTLYLPLPFLHMPSHASYELGYIVEGRLWWSGFASTLCIDIRRASAVAAKWSSIFRKFRTEVQVHKIVQRRLTFNAQPSQFTFNSFKLQASSHA